MSESIYSWSFDSRKNRGSLWYIIVLSISVWLIIWWFLSKQYWMSFVIIILLWLGFYIENNSEDLVNVEILDSWIKIDNNFYNFSSILKYAIVYDNDSAVILRIILPNKIWTRNIDLSIDNQILSDVKKILDNFLEESPKDQLSVSEKVVRMLKL